MEQTQVVITPQFANHYVRYAKGALLCEALPSIGKEYESYFGFTFASRTDRAQPIVVTTEVLSGDRFEVVTYKNDIEGRMVITIRRAVFLELRISPSIEHRVEILFYEWDAVTSEPNFEKSTTVIPPRSLTRRINDTDQEGHTVRLRLQSDWMPTSGRNEILLALGVRPFNLNTTDGKERQARLLRRAQSIVTRRLTNNDEPIDDAIDMTTHKRGRPSKAIELDNSDEVVEKIPKKRSSKKKMKENAPLTATPVTDQAFLIFDGHQFSSVLEMTHFCSQELSRLRGELQTLNAEKQQWQTNTKLQLELAYFKGRCEGVSGTKVDTPF